MTALTRSCFILALLGSLAIPSHADGLKPAGGFETGFPRVIENFSRLGKHYVLLTFERWLVLFDATQGDAALEVARIETRGLLADIAISNSHVFAVSGSGLEVIRITESATLVPVAHVPGKIHLARERAGLLYCLESPNGLRIFDVTDPVRPVEVGGYRDSRSSLFLDIAFRDRYAYLTTLWGLHTLDMVDPLRPISVDSLVIAHAYPSPNVGNMEIAGDFAQVAVGSESNFGYSDIVSLDLRNSNRPREVGRIAGAGGSRLFAADDVLLSYLGRRFRIASILDPNTPRLLYYVPNDAVAAPLTNFTGLSLIAGTRSALVIGYGASDSNYLQHLDFRDPDRPVWKAVPLVTTSPFLSIREFRRLLVRDSTLLAVKDYDILSWDIADPFSPVPMKKFRFNYPSTYGMLEAGRWVYSFSVDGWCTRLDVSNPRELAWARDSLLTPGVNLFRDIHAVGEIIYFPVSRGYRGVDVSDPANPRDRGLIYFPGDAPVVRASAADSGNLYVADARSSRVLRIDVRSPDTLRLGTAIPMLPADFAADTLPSWEPPGTKMAAGNGALAFYSASGLLWAMDIRDPANPVRAAPIRLAHPPREMKKIGPYLYTRAYGQFSVYDLSIPSTPRWVADYQPAEPITAMKVAGKRIYLGLGGSDENYVAGARYLRIFDLEPIQIPVAVRKRAPDWKSAAPGLRFDRSRILIRAAGGTEGDALGRPVSAQGNRQVTAPRP